MEEAIETTNSELNSHSWVALAIFLAALVFVIRPVDFALPKIGWRVYFNLATAPPLGVLILLASHTIDWINIRNGLLGNNMGVEPYAIMLLFYSLVCNHDNNNNGSSSSMIYEFWRVVVVVVGIRLAKKNKR